MIGLLFGSQNGLDVSIYDAMEVACTAVGADGLELNEALVEKQKDLCELPPLLEYVAGDLRACHCRVPAFPASSLNRPCRRRKECWDLHVLPFVGEISRS